MESSKIIVETTIHAPIEKIWICFTTPAHIMQWNSASSDWHTPKAENNLVVGGRFNYTMAAKDGSFSFDFLGVYDEIILHKRIAYTLGDGRKVTVDFKNMDQQTLITETFEAESQNDPARQKAGWQAILDNFKRYVQEVELDK